MISASTVFTFQITAAVNLIAACPPPTRSRLYEIVVDSGIHAGGDVAVALALGADMAFVGRAYVYAVAAAGERGVAHLLRILTDELRSVMQLVGVNSVAQLRSEGLQLLAEAVQAAPAN